MPLGVGRGQNFRFCIILTLLLPGASVFHKHMSSSSFISATCLLLPICNSVICSCMHYGNYKHMDGNYKLPPFLGVCLGLQCAVIEFARNKMGWTDAHSTEVDPNTKHPVVGFLNMSWLALSYVAVLSGFVT